MTLEQYHTPPIECHRGGLVTIATQIRLDDKLHEKLVAIAKSENRSLNNLMVHLLAQSVKNYEGDISEKKRGRMD